MAIPKDIRVRNYCFTLNNHSDEELFKITRLFDESDLLSYIVYGIEMGDSGTEHLQGYIECLRQGILRPGGV